jgi:hypothetical protein
MDGKLKALLTTSQACLFGFYVCGTGIQEKRSKSKNITEMRLDVYYNNSSAIRLTKKQVL